MSAQNFKGLLETAKQQIVDINAKMAALARAKEQALSMGDAATAIKSNHELKALQDRLEDLTITKAAFEAKLRIYKTNETEALKIIRRLADELWPAALAEYNQLKRIHGEFLPALEKITQLNNEMEALANQIKRLIGDRIYTPRIPCPPELNLVATAKFGVDPPKSLDIRLGTDRERDHIADQLKEQRPVVSKILGVLHIDWPLCQTCGAELLATRYKLADDKSHGYASLSCSQHPLQWMEVDFPARASPPGARWPIPSKDPLPPGDIRGSVPAIQSHGLAPPSLTTQNKGGKKAT